MKRKKILLADNREQDIQETRKALLTSGFEVRVAQASQEILAYIDTFLPDLLIVETRMPELDLNELITSLRAKSATRFMPIVAIGAPRTVPERLHVIEMGVDDFLYKPFEIEELLVRVETLVREAASASEQTPVVSRGFSGSLAEMTLVDLLQTLDVGRKTGITRLQNATGSEGYVAVTNGEVVHAEMPGLDARASLQKMFTWADGHFSVDMRTHDAQRTVVSPTRELISEGMTRQYRWQQLTAQLPSLHSFGIAKPELPGVKKTADEDRIYQQFVGARRFMDVIDESEYDDLKALRLMKALFDKGLLAESPGHPGLLSDRNSEGHPQGGTNGTTASTMMAGVFSELLREPDGDDGKRWNRRKSDRRRGDRRRQDRRRAVGTSDPIIWLNKTELIMLREKLLTGIRRNNHSQNGHTDADR